MKTYIPSKESIERKWYILDAKGAVLGRLASKAARILTGKTKPIYTPRKRKRQEQGPCARERDDEVGHQRMTYDETPQR